MFTFFFSHLAHHGCATLPVQMANDPWGDENRQDKNKGDQPPDLDEFFRKIIHPKGGGNKPPKTPFKWRENKKTFAIIIITVVLAWLATGFYQLADGQQGVVSFLGKYTKTSDNKFNWHAPYPLGSVEKIDTKAHLSLRFGQFAPAQNNIPLDGELLSKNGQLLNVGVRVEYHIADAQRYLTASQNPQQLVYDAIAASARSLVGAASLNTLLATSKNDLAAQLKTAISEKVQALNLGVTVDNVQEVYLEMPPEVSERMKTAQQHREAAKAKLAAAQKAAQERLTSAQEKAKTMLEQAQFTAQQQVVKAQAESKRFNTLLDAYDVNPELMRTRLYLQTLQDILDGDNRKVMVASDNPQPVIEIAPQAPAAVASPATPAPTPKAPAAKPASAAPQAQKANENETPPADDARGRSASNLRSR